MLKLISKFLRSASGFHGKRLSHKLAREISDYETVNWKYSSQNIREGLRKRALVIKTSGRKTLSDSQAELAKFFCWLIYAWEKVRVMMMRSIGAFSKNLDVCLDDDFSATVSLIQHSHILTIKFLTIYFVFYFKIFQVVPATRLAILPPAFTKDAAYATEYVLAWAVLPTDEEDKVEAYKMFAQDVLNKTLQLNVEFT